MNILRVSSSARGGESVSFRLSEQILRAQRKAVDSQDTLYLDEIDAAQLPHIDNEYALKLITRGADSESLRSKSLRLSDDLIRRLQEADAVIIATPMHNFTVPSSLKAWIDHVVRVGITFNITEKGKVGALADRPVYIAISAGGVFTGPHANQPNFLTDYLKTVFETIGLKSIHFFSVQGAARGADHLDSEFERVESELAEHFSLV